MSYFAKFQPQLRQWAQTLPGFQPSEMASMWLQLINMVGEEQFNSLVTPYIECQYEQYDNAEIACSAMAKALRQGDHFEGFVRQKQVEVPHPNQEKFPGKTVRSWKTEESINGRVDMLFRNMNNLDNTQVFFKVFEFYFNMHQANPEAPTLEFVFETNGKDREWSRDMHGLLGVRALGEEEFWSEEKIRTELHSLDYLPNLIIQGMKHYRQTVGLEEKPKDGPRYACLEQPMYEGGREVEAIVKNETLTGKPFKWTNTIVEPQPKETEGVQEQ